MVRLSLSLLACSSLLLLASACGSDPPTITAKASLVDSAGVAVGTFAFTQLEGEPVKLTITIATTSTTVLPGEHGMHMHLGKTCVPPLFTSAGDHWNPGMMLHGHPGPNPHHAGDLGNIMLDANKSGAMEMTSAEMTLLPGDATKYITGKTIIFHANRDDGVTQMPYGNSGKRLACGVIGP